jgi:hypothetical protein
MVMKKAIKATDGRHHHHHILKVVEGNHSTRTEYSDGHIKFVTHWVKLLKEVRTVLAGWDATQPKVVPIKKSRKKKIDA